MLYKIIELVDRFRLVQRHRVLLSVVGAGIVLCSLFAGLYFARISQAEIQTDEHLLTVYDRGEQTSVLTKQATIGQALKEANIHLDTSDHVEPDASSQLVAKTYQVNIYRARPVTVIDGNVRQRVMTSYQTAQQIIKSANIQLYTEDQADVQRNNDVVADGAGLTVTIKRATPFNFTLYGQTFVARTQAKTVGAMLKDKNVTLGKDDRVSVPLDTPITDGLAIRVWHEGKQTITQDEDVNFDTQQIQDADQPVGYKKVQTPGVKGKKSVTYEVIIQDGKEVNRREINSTVVQQPTTQIEVVGTKNAYSGSRSEWLSALRSCEGSYTSNTGNGYYGAYQFSASTWDRTAQASGRSDLVGTLPSNASPADQDAMIIANTNRSSGGLASQNPGCYRKLGLSAFPPD